MRHPDGDMHFRFGPLCEALAHLEVELESIRTRWLEAVRLESDLRAKREEVKARLMEVEQARLLELERKLERAREAREKNGPALQAGRLGRAPQQPWGWRAPSRAPAAKSWSPEEGLPSNVNEAGGRQWATRTSSGRSHSSRSQGR